VVIDWLIGYIICMKREDKNWLFIRDAREYVTKRDIDFTFGDLIDCYKMRIAISKAESDARIIAEKERIEVNKRHVHNMKDRHGRFYYRAATANSEARKAGVNGKVSAAELEKLYTDNDGLCFECFSTDHIIFSKIKSFEDGGTNTVDNLRLLCRVCNMKRTVKDKR
jgi:hypothetical protein